MKYMNDHTKAPIVLDVPASWTIRARPDGRRVQIEIEGCTTHAETARALVAQFLKCVADVLQNADPPPNKKKQAP